MTHRVSSKIVQDLSCPCSSNSPKKSYASCCKTFHEGVRAPTPELLMRSRYSAYAFGIESYLLETWHASTRPSTPLLDENSPSKWVELQIKNTSMNESTGTVEFVAIYKIAGKAYRLHEISHFVKENDHWYYVDGHFPELK